MKTCLRMLASTLAICLCLVSISPAVLADGISPIRGDCNADNAVNMKDVLTLRQYMAGTVTAFPPHDCLGVNRPLVRGDANADGDVNMKDVLTLRKFVAGVISALPPCSCQEEADAHSVSVVKGSANVDEAMPGETVFLTADLPEHGFEFDRWICDSGNVMPDDARSELATFVMPNEPVMLTATYTPIVYTVFVISGEASELHPAPGERVTVTANSPHRGEQFDRWVVSGVEIEDISLTTITFVMPESNVSLIATYCEQ